MKKWNILLVEDEWIISEDIRRVLLESLDCQVEVAMSKQEALQLFKEKRFDFLIVDVGLKADGNGIELIEELKAKYPPLPKFFFLTAFKDDETLEHIRNTGAQGYFPKPFPPQGLVTNLRMHLEITDVADDDMGERIKKLTRRESDIVRLMMDGRSTDEIAEALYIAKSTVETHRKNIYKKLEINSLGKIFQFAKFM